jgi:septal ring factor EnvC (AmiA/AmiB activator)
MKRTCVLAVATLLALSGCASGKFLGFLATSGYVDRREKEQAEEFNAKAKEQAAQFDAKAKEQEAEIATLKAQLADYQSIKTQALAAIDQMNQMEKTVQELQATAQRVEAKIGSIPHEVIRQISDILQASLNH